jgi:DNA processing protein
LTEELKYQIALGNVAGIGPILGKLLIQTLGSAKAVMTSKVANLHKVEGLGIVRAKAIASYREYDWIEKEMKFMQQHQISAISFLDENYPYRLKQCIDAPIVIYFKGEINLNNQRIISIVGRRKNTEYGRKITEELIDKLKEFHPLIISGLALGIDIIAHKACLQNNLPTVAVLAHGLDRIYPTQHRNIAKEMLDYGGLLTEYPSGTIPDKQNFPMRNRIVAGMADATIVIETDVKGGSMITANLANSYNRDVFTFPGSVYSNASSGCHYLIKSLKANLITSADDVIDLLGWDASVKKQKAPQRELFIELSENEKIIFELLQKHEQLSIDEITILSKLSPSLIAGATLSLEMQNIIAMQPGKIYRLL